MLLSFSNLNNEKQENYLYHSQGVVTWLGKGEWGEEVRRGKRRKLHSFLTRQVSTGLLVIITHYITLLHLKSSLNIMFYTHTHTNT